jgi:hypothetical protein
MNLKTDYIDRFWHRVQKGSGCWEWTGKPHSEGYGRAQVAPDITEFAHRVSWVIANGPIPEGLCVLHTCDNPPCVRPSHLFLGTRGDNARDMAAKGRQHLQRNPDAALRGDRHWSRRKPERVLRGTAHNQSKLTEPGVIEIRERFAAGEGRTSLAKAFGVSPGNIDFIVRGQTWRHVGGPTLTEQGNP